MHTISSVLCCLFFGVLEIKSTYNLIHTRESDYSVKININQLRIITNLMYQFYISPTPTHQIQRCCPKTALRDIFPLVVTKLQHVPTDKANS